MKSSFISTIIYIDHDAALDIIKQITLTIFFIDKLNLRLIRASNYIQRFNLKLRHKSNAQHIISNAFSRLFSLNKKQQLIDDEKKLNALFTITMCEMNEVFRIRLLKNYRNDSIWKKIFDLLNVQKISAENNVFFLYRKNDLIFRFDEYIIDNHVFEFRRLCISQLFITKIFDIMHDANHDHFDFRKCYEQLIFFYFMRRLFK